MLIFCFFTSVESFDIQNLFSRSMFDVIGKIAFGQV
jgi:hypothetical protein